MMEQTVDAMIQFFGAEYILSVHKCRVVVCGDDIADEEETEKWKSCKGPVNNGSLSLQGGFIMREGVRAPSEHDRPARRKCRAHLEGNVAASPTPAARVGWVDGTSGWARSGLHSSRGKP